MPRLNNQDKKPREDVKDTIIFTLQVIAFIILALIGCVLIFAAFAVGFMELGLTDKLPMGGGIFGLQLGALGLLAFWGAWKIYEISGG